MEKMITRSIQSVINTCRQLEYPETIEFIEDAAHLLAQTFQKGNKVLIAGNGGSLCDAIHFAQELTGFYRKKRPALPAIALSEPGHITCVGNDAGFEKIFSRGLEAYGKPGDLFVGMSTSGSSKNIVEAFSVALDSGLRTIAFLGKDGGALKGVADLELLITGVSTADRIQEVHMAAIHVIIEVVESLLFSSHVDALYTQAIKE